MIDSASAQDKKSLQHQLASLIKQKKKIILVYNKTDKTPKAGQTKTIPSLPADIPVILISALKRTGINKLKNAILKTLGLADIKISSGMPVIFTRRQFDVVRKMLN